MRDYDPTLGRYIQGDPLGLVDGASVYGYARQNPGRYIDPRGESAAAGVAGFIAGDAAIPDPTDVAPLPKVVVYACALAIAFLIDGVTSDDDEAARCKTAREICHRNCVAYFEGGPFPGGSGPPQFLGYRRCMRECMDARDCPY